MQGVFMPGEPGAGFEAEPRYTKNVAAKARMA